MRKELQNKLYAKYPKLLSNLHEDPKLNSSPLAWDGIDVGDGWYDIIDTLCEEITRHSQSCQAQQIKEKFGGLRFYIDSGDEQIWKLIRKAEDTAYIVCELCGSFENIGKTDGWTTTMCKDCYDKTGDGRHWHPIGDK